MQNLRLGSIVSISVGQSQTSDINAYSGAVVNHLTDAYIEFTDAGGGIHAYPWGRVLSVTVTAS